MKRQRKFQSHRKPQPLTDARRAVLKAYRIEERSIEVVGPSGKKVRMRVPVKVYPALHELPKALLEAMRRDA